MALFLTVAVALSVLASGALVWSRRVRAASSSPTPLVRAEKRRLDGWLFFLAGCLLALPALAFYSRIMLADNDSARLLASILHVQREGIDHLVETQEVLLPHVLLGPIVSLGGIEALQAVNVLSVLALAGVVAFLSWRLTGSSVGAVAGVLALTALGQILKRTFLTPMYPAMLAFGFLGVYLAYRAVQAEERGQRWRAAVLAALCLVVSLEAHQFGQLFVLLSGLLLLATPSLRAVGGLARVYLCLAVLSLPRAILNLADGGLSHFFSNRVDYWATKGYLESIQVEVLDYPRELGLGEYLRKLPEGVLDAWGATGWLTLALGAASILAAPARLRRFVVGCTLLLLVVMVQLRLPFFPRYFSLLLVGSALAAGVTIAALARRGTFPWRAAAAAAVVGLLAANAVNYHLELDRLQTQKADLVQGPYRRLAREIGPGEGVIGTRSFHLTNTSTNPSTYGEQFLTESEYRIFLTWPSEAEVIELMGRRDAQWVYVPSRQARWVSQYNNVWLGSAYGEEARYHDEVARSSSFCLARRAGGAALYRLDPGGHRSPGDNGRRCAP